MPIARGLVVAVVAALVVVSCDSGSSPPHATRTTRPVVQVPRTPFGVVPDRFRERATYEFTFTKPGTYAYYCSVHGLPHQGMFGSVEVTAK